MQKQQQLVANGKSPERSESPNSTSTATSAGTVTPPSGRSIIYIQTSKIFFFFLINLNKVFYIINCSLYNLSALTVYFRQLILQCH